MADLGTNPVRARAHALVVVAGSFRPNGASAIDNTQNVGRGFTVTRAGAGVYDITLEQKYPRLVSAQVQLQLATAAASVGVVTGAADPSATNPVVRVTVLTESAGTFAAADVASNAQNRVHFTFVLQNSSVV